MPVSIDRRGALSLVLCMFAVGCSSASATKSVDGYETRSRARPEQEVVARMQAIVKKRKRNEDDTPVKSWRSFGVATPGARLTERDFQMWIDWLERDGQIERGRVRARDVYRADLQR